MPVLSFGEGSPTAVLMTLPQLVVVPEGSAYPGQGLNFGFRVGF